MRVGGVDSEAARALCDRLAQAGFPALAPDLYGGAEAKDRESAAALATALKWDDAKPRIEAGIAEVWIVDPVACTIERHTVAGVERARGAESIASSSIPGFALVPDALFGPA